ncbi:MAG: hypothetical protein HY063_08725 [Bacteroidetes bacterium]|nr:hypothetical protein [Bacteroidota bacterium]
MKNTVTFFSFELEERQILSLSTLDNIIKEKEKDNEVKKEKGNSILRLEELIKEMEQHILSRQKEFFVEDKKLFDRFIKWQIKLYDILSKINAMEYHYPNDNSYHKKKRNIMLLELLKEKKKHFLFKQKEFSSEENKLFKKFDSGGKKMNGLVIAFLIR